LNNVTIKLCSLWSKWTKN